MRILIIGGGTAGITVAAQLLKKRSDCDVLILEPSDTHYYQPGWTLVGGGVFSAQRTARPMASVIPKRARWIKGAARSFYPERNSIELESGETLSYDFLVVCPGLHVGWDKIKGLNEALTTDRVGSIYRFDTAPALWKKIQTFKGGTALFTHPATPVKCGGAPQKIMYLADDAFRRQIPKGRYHIIFNSGLGRLFSVDEYERTLLQVVKRRNIDLNFTTNLVEIRPNSQEAVFHSQKAGEQIVSYDFLHVVPPMAAPSFVKESPLAATAEGPTAGFVEVDTGTLQHKKFANVFALGDAAAVPTSKTGAAIRKQAPVVVHNLLVVKEGRPVTQMKRYDGYTSCPLVTGYGKLVLAEFDYSVKPKETFPFNQNRERYSMWLFKRHFLPWMYWNLMLRGRA